MHSVLLAPSTLREMHGWHVAARIADQTVKDHIGLVDVSRTVSSSLGPALRHRIEALSSSLGDDPTAVGVSSSLALCHHFRFGLLSQVIGSIFGWSLFFGLRPAEDCTPQPVALSAWLTCRVRVCWRGGAGG
jgi:hypothetical protein